MSNTVKKTKRILVTGGAGFLGSHLMDLLVSQGHSVYCLDNFYTGTKQNLHHIQGLFQWIEHDVCKPFDLDPVDEIYHLASPASPYHYQKDPIMTLKTNILGAMHVLDLAKRCHAKVLLASTSEVYGDPESHPQVETYYGSVNPNGIRACYDEGKRCAETLFSDYHRFYGVEVRIARIFNTFGPRMQANDGRVVSNFILQALQNQPITVFGEGKQTRSFCYVSDLVEGLEKLMEKGDHTPVNLGNPEEMTILQLAELIAQLCRVSVEMTFATMPADDPKRRKPCIKKASQLLGWAPQISVEEGLQRTIHFLKKQLMEPRAFV